MMCDGRRLLLLLLCAIFNLIRLLFKGGKQNRTRAHAATAATAAARTQLRGGSRSFMFVALFPFLKVFLPNSLCARVCGVLFMA